MAFGATYSRVLGWRSRTLTGDRTCFGAMTVWGVGGGAFVDASGKLLIEPERDRGQAGRFP